MGGQKLYVEKAAVLLGCPRPLGVLPRCGPRKAHVYLSAPSTGSHHHNVVYSHGQRRLNRLDGGLALKKHGISNHASKHPFQVDASFRAYVAPVSSARRKDPLAGKVRKHNDQRGAHAVCWAKANKLNFLCCNLSGHLQGAKCPTLKTAEKQPKKVLSGSWAKCR